jgi:molybdopterin converting factor small subunit
VTVKVRIPTMLRDYAGGSTVVEVEGTTGREVLAAIEARHPALGRRVTDEQGLIRRHVHVYVGEDRLLDLDTSVPDGADVTILAAVSGG